MSNQSNGATNRVAKEFQDVLKGAVGDATHDHDPVHSPSHYKAGGFEAVEIIEAFAPTNVHRSHSLKYLLRAGRKGGRHLRPRICKKPCGGFSANCRFTEECGNENS